MKKTIVITALALLLIIAIMYLTLGSKIGSLVEKLDVADKAVTDLQNQIKLKDEQISKLSEKVEEMDMNTWMYSATNQIYHNEKFDFSIKLPYEFLKKADIQESENEQVSRVTFFYNGYTYEDGSKQPFFWVEIVPKDEQVTGNGGEEVLAPFMVKDDKAYYLQMPIETGLPEKENKEYQYFFISYPMLLERVATE